MKTKFFTLVLAIAFPCFLSEASFTTPQQIATGISNNSMIELGNKSSNFLLNNNTEIISKKIKGRKSDETKPVNAGNTTNDNSTSHDGDGLHLHHHDEPHHEDHECHLPFPKLFKKLRRYLSQIIFATLTINLFKLLFTFPFLLVRDHLRYN